MKGGVLPNIQVVKAGVGDQNGVLRLFLNDKNAGGHSFKKDIFSVDEGIRDSIEVPIVTIDNFVEAQNLKGIDVLKIDTQGFEEEVLKGGAMTISRFNPVVLIETNNGQGSKTQSTIRTIKETLPHHAFAKVGSNEFHHIDTLEDFLGGQIQVGNQQTDLLFFRKV